MWSTQWMSGCTVTSKQEGPRFTYWSDRGPFCVDFVGFCVVFLQEVCSDSPKTCMLMLIGDYIVTRCECQYEWCVFTWCSFNSLMFLVLTPCFLCRDGRMTTSPGIHRSSVASVMFLYPVNFCGNRTSSLKKCKWNTVECIHYSPHHVEHHFLSFLYLFFF